MFRATDGISGKLLFSFFLEIPGYRMQHGSRPQGRDQWADHHVTERYMVDVLHDCTSSFVRLCLCWETGVNFPLDVLSWYSLQSLQESTANVQSFPLEVNEIQTDMLKESEE